MNGPKAFLCYLTDRQIWPPSFWIYIWDIVALAVLRFAVSARLALTLQNPAWFSLPGISRKTMCFLSCFTILGAISSRTWNFFKLNYFSWTLNLNEADTDVTYYSQKVISCWHAPWGCNFLFYSFYLQHLERENDTWGFTYFSPFSSGYISYKCFQSYFENKTTSFAVWISHI